MRNIKWFATAAAGALILAGVANSSAKAFVPKVSQIDPFQIMTNAKDLPTTFSYAPSIFWTADATYCRPVRFAFIAGPLVAHEREALATHTIGRRPQS